jgi:hypothetical protein
MENHNAGRRRFVKTSVTGTVGGALDLLDPFGGFGCVTILQFV